MAFPSCVGCCGRAGPGDPACAAPHPADDRGAGYVRSVAALSGRRVRGESARRSAWRRQSRAGTSRNGGGRRLRGVPQEGRYPHCTDEETTMSTEENKAIVGRWFTEFWGKEFNPAVIDELAAPDVRFAARAAARPGRGPRVRAEVPRRVPGPELLGHRRPDRRGRLRGRP